ncbi:hypothetical protein BH11PLA2_BH11PLA2_02920 [soil metagenome]
MTREEVDHAVGDGSIKGSEAAAVAALKRAVRSTKYKLPELTKESLLKMAETKSSAETPDLNAFHNMAPNKIATANRVLFAAWPELHAERPAMHHQRLRDQERPL